MIHIGRLNKSIPVLLLIILIASFLRIWQIGKIPVGFTPDEASFGYDAYSILKTGKDQWGHFLPVVLESFGDYKSPLYAYLTIPVVAVLGLNEISVRLPNAIVGIAAVFILYLLVDEIGIAIKLKKSEITLLQICSSFLLAISSWHVMMSRGAFEANLITLFIPLGIYLFLKGVKDKIFLIFSSIVFGLSLFTYHSSKFLTPVILTALIIIFRKNIAENLNKYIFPVAIFIIFLSLMLYSQVIGGSSRISERSITRSALEDGAKAKISAIQGGQDPFIARILHNKYQVTASRFITNYRQYFSAGFLFTKGPAETTYGMLPGLGVLYLFEGLLLLGLIPLVIYKKETRTLVGLILLWLIIAPVPAALATGVGYSANRAEGMIPALQILLAFGVLGINEYLKKFDKKVVLAVSFLVAVFAANNMGKTWNEYFINSPAIQAGGMLYGRGESVAYAGKNLNNYQKIIFSRTLSEPQIYVAFYSKYDPRIFQKESENWAVYRTKNLSFLDQLGEYELGKYVFKNINYKMDSQAKEVLIIGKPEEFPSGVTPIVQIAFPDGKPGIFIVKP